MLAIMGALPNVAIIGYTEWGWGPSAPESLGMARGLRAGFCCAPSPAPES
jgi:hypothetical protein